MFNKLKMHLSDNNGMAYIEKLVLICIAFVAGAALLAVLWGVFRDPEFQGGMSESIGDAFNW